MPAGRRLLRSEVRAALLGKKARLTVILTDCRAGTTQGPGIVGAARPADLEPVLRRLLFRHSGLMDINACSIGEYACCDPRKGGDFTSALVADCEHLASVRRTASWHELFPAVTGRT